MRSFVKKRYNRNDSLCKRISQWNALREGIAMKSYVQWNRNVIFCKKESQCIRCKKGIAMYFCAEGNLIVSICEKNRYGILHKWYGNGSLCGKNQIGIIYKENDVESYIKRHDHEIPCRMESQYNFLQNGMTMHLLAQRNAIQKNHFVK